MKERKINAVLVNFVVIFFLATKFNAVVY